MPKPTPYEVLADPDFFALPLQARLSVMDGIDPEFASLDDGARQIVVSSVPRPNHNLPPVDTRPEPPKVSTSKIGPTPEKSMGAKIRDMLFAHQPEGTDDNLRVLAGEPSLSGTPIQQITSRVNKFADEPLIHTSELGPTAGGRAPKTAIEGAVGGGLEAIEGLTTPKNAGLAAVIAATGPVGAAAGTAVFAPQMIGGGLQAAKGIYDSVVEGGEDLLSPENVQSGVGAVVNLLMGRKALKGGKAAVETELNKRPAIVARERNSTSGGTVTSAVRAAKEKRARDTQARFDQATGIGIENAEKAAETKFIQDGGENVKTALEAGLGTFAKDTVANRKAKTGLDKLDVNAGSKIATAEVEKGVGQLATDLIANKKARKGLDKADIAAWEAIVENERKGKEAADKEALTAKEILRKAEEDAAEKLEADKKAKSEAALAEPFRWDGSGRGRRDPTANMGFMGTGYLSDKLADLFAKDISKLPEAEQIAKRNAGEREKARFKATDDFSPSRIYSSLVTNFVDATFPITAPFEDAAKGMAAKGKGGLAPSQNPNYWIDRALGSNTAAENFLRSNDYKSIIQKVPDLDVLDEQLTARHVKDVTIHDMGRKLLKKSKNPMDQAIFEEMAAKDPATKELAHQMYEQTVRKYGDLWWESQKKQAAIDPTSAPKLAHGGGRSVYDIETVINQPNLDPSYTVAMDKFKDLTRKLEDEHIIGSGIFDPDRVKYMQRIYPNYFKMKYIGEKAGVDLNSAIPGGDYNPGTKGSPALMSLRKQTAVVKRGSGKEAPLESPLNTFPQRVREVFGQAERNRAAKALADLREVPVYNKLIKEAMPGEKGLSNKNSFAYLEDGKQRVFKTTPEIAEAVNSLNPEELPKIIQFFFQPTARALRFGATGANPLFVAKNIIKDVFSTFINAPNGGRVNSKGRMLAAADMTLPKGAKKALGLDENLQSELAQHGGGFTSNVLTRSDPMTTNARLRMLKHPVEYGKHTVLHPVNELGAFLNKVEDTLSKSEEFSRLSLYAAQKEAYLKSGQMSPKEAEIQAAIDANHVLPAYRRAGRRMRAFQSAIPYLGAGIQGARSNLAALKNRPVSTAMKFGTVMALPVVMSTLWNLSNGGNRKALFDISPEELKSNLVFINDEDGEPDPKTGKYDAIKIPIPQGWSSAANLLQNELLNAYQNDPEGFKKLTEHFLGPDEGGVDDSKEQYSGYEQSAISRLQTALGTVAPFEATLPSILSTVMPTTGRAATELVMGYDLFRNKSRLKPFSNQPKSLQTAPNTTQFAKDVAKSGVGKSINASPMDIDALVRNLTGGLGSQVMYGMEAARGIPKEDRGGQNPLEGVEDLFKKPSVAAVLGLIQPQKAVGGFRAQNERTHIESTHNQAMEGLYEELSSNNQKLLERNSREPGKLEQAEGESNEEFKLRAKLRGALLDMYLDQNRSAIEAESTRDGRKEVFKGIMKDVTAHLKELLDDSFMELSDEDRLEYIKQALPDYQRKK